VDILQIVCLLTTISIPQTIFLTSEHLSTKTPSVAKDEVGVILRPGQQAEEAEKTELMVTAKENCAGTLAITLSRY
jgi:hypothetical protein